MNILLIFMIIISLQGRNFAGPAGMIHCQDRPSCLHEIGHVVDKGTSSDAAFRKIVLLYLGMAICDPEKPDEWEMRVLLFPGFGAPRLEEQNPLFRNHWEGGWGGWRELYASMLEWSDGDPKEMPEIFRHYYPWERIGELCTAMGPKCEAR